MRIIIGVLLPLLVMAQSHDLKTFMTAASENNGLLKSKEINVKSKEQEMEAAKSAYWPTVDIGGDYSVQTPNYLASPGRTGNVFVSANLNLYDGGRKEAILKSKNFEHQASLFEKAAFKKSIVLKIVKYFYGIQTQKAVLKALEERAKELEAQIVRVKKFKGAALSTQEDIDKLISVYENNNFTIENTRLLLETNQENLHLISGISAKQLKRNYFLEPHHIQFEYFETIKILQAHANAIGENASAINAGYMPQVNLSDTYHKAHFDDRMIVPGLSGDGFLVDHQNKLGFSVNMRIFDNGKMAKKSEAVKYQKLSLFSQVDHAKREQHMHFKLANKSLSAERTKLKSVKAALKAAQSTYRVIRQKFEVGLVDNIAFLDALAQRTLAEARYKETVYGYEVSKSIYYYYAGKDPEEFIR